MLDTDGFTCELWLSNAFQELHVMVHPEADLDGTFLAWCLDNECLLSVNGWTFSIDDTQGDDECMLA